MGCVCSKDIDSCDSVPETPMCYEGTPLIPKIKKGGSIDEYIPLIFSLHSQSSQARKANNNI